eukprot:TRINITY_DN173424_c0_g1_i5.p1 TRINITY_DN173424_c0_g1~~TRINITY_DN173424_c0_g1_i5.p1  ORF type:complete len:128 (+),score=19.32 TRINITY_DN173424_c0_g1_i5:16-399(+)
MVTHISNLKKFTLLYVEDEDVIRSNVVNCLQYLFNVVVAKDGQDGLNKFNNSKIDLIITDLNMPNKNGIFMLEEIKKLSPKIPTIVTSAYNDDVESQLAKVGVSKCIQKPFDIKQLIQDSMDILKNK